MTDAAKPASTGQTQPGKAGSLTAVPLAPPRRVTYIFNATSSSNLRIPYAVAVNGAAQAAFSHKPRRVDGSAGKIETFVEQGSKVSLFLNSDAHPHYRKEPVYEVAVGDNDIVVNVTEKSGKHSDSDKPVLQKAKAGEIPAVDRYAAPLTGDIWMKVSHKYQAAEVDALVEAGTSEAVKAAVKSIYSGLASSTLSITEPAAAANASPKITPKPARSVKVTFNDSNNPKDNINAYKLLSDGLPRVHPAGYAAMFTAALDNGIESLIVSSCWRPMLGSIAHRAGLGLDVSALGKTTLNRQELRSAFEGQKPAKKGDGNDSDNVSDAEVIKFGEYETAIVANKRARTEREAAQKALVAAQKGKDAAAIAKATERRDVAVVAVQDTAAAEARTGREWNKERDAAEPTNARLFRASLLKCRCIEQIFDPWYMDANTRDAEPPEANMQLG